jgi:hypothetical protein
MRHAVSFGLRHRASDAVAVDRKAILISDT